MSVNLDVILNDIIYELSEIACPDNKKVDVWKKIIAQIKEKESFDRKYGHIIEQYISFYISKLKREDKISIWLETETGQESALAVEYFPLDVIEMDLENELMYEIIECAYNPDLTVPQDF